MKYIASCSFGKDSLAMVLRLLEESKPLDEVIFFDTGMEFDSIYHNRNRIKELLFQKHIRFTELHSQNTFLFDMFVRPVKYKNPQNKSYPMHYGYEWCGGNVRWGTSGKLSAIRKHCVVNNKSSYSIFSKNVILFLCKNSLLNKYNGQAVLNSLLVIIFPNIFLPVEIS